MEVLVSVSLFVIVVTVAAGALVSVIQSNRKSTSLDLATDNIQVAVDQMSRGIQRGDTYHCGDEGAIDTTRKCDASGESLFAFEPEGGDAADNSDQIVYKLLNDRVVKSTDGGASFHPLTAESVNVKNLTFYSQQDSEGDPSKIQIVMEAETTDEDKSQSSLNTQTTVTSINLQTMSETFGKYSQNPYCPVEEMGGQILLDFSSEKEENTVLWAPGNKHPEHRPLAWRGAFHLPEPVEPGREFRVRIITWDNHCDENGDNCHSPQDNEQMYIELWDGDENVLFKSNLTEDIPTNVNMLPPPWEVNSGVTIPESAELLAFYGYSVENNGEETGSLVPACVAIEYNDTPASEINVDEF